MKDKILSFYEINKLSDKISENLLQKKIRKIALIGDLGVGKTHFVKRICKNLGINETVKSPTFNYVNTYENNDIKISHFDVYRLNDSYEIFDIGYEDYIDDDKIVLIEWADKILDILDDEYLYINFEHYDDEERIINIYYIKNGEIEYANIINDK